MSKSDDAKLCRKGGRKEVVELQRRRNENAKYLCTHMCLFTGRARGSTQLESDPELEV